MYPINSILIGQSHQRGMVLGLALIMLLLLGLLATAGVTSNNIAGQLLRNDQRRQLVHQSAENIVTFLIGKPDYFIRYPQYLDSSGQFSPQLPDYLLTEFIDNPQINMSCIAETATVGCSLDQSSSCAVDYYWQIQVKTVDQISGINIQINQGIRFSYLPGYCFG
ncbi:MAG: hypothetical protein ACPH3I_00665 [Porticoccaceae bacterium]